MTHEIDRRVALGVAVAAAGLTTAAFAQSPPSGAAPLGLSPRPLPFDAASIAGLSAQMITSHHENNYAGAVRRLGAIEAQLAGLDFASAPGFAINGLKREALIAMNSMILHELYFGGFAGQARTPGARLGQRIERDFGSVSRWAQEFAAMGKAQSGGSGWVLLNWSPRLSRLTNTWAADHTMTGADGMVLVALDMYEHAYAIDYGARAGAYVDAFMGALRWDTANAVFEGAAA